MPKPNVKLHLCKGCGPHDPAALQRRLDAVFQDCPVRVVSQACMNGCAKPVSMGLQADGLATCFFAGVDPDADAEDIISTIQTYLDAPKGWIEDARPCGRLRFCLVGRVPAN